MVVPPPMMGGPPLPVGKPPVPPLASVVNPVTAGWVVTPEMLTKYNAYYNDRPKDAYGRVAGKETALFLEASGLERNIIARVLELSDIDNDKCFDQEEFALAMHLALCISRRNMPVPAKLDDYLVPPSKRTMLGLRPL